jgi:tRNA-(ms[2]io[6]A)-hydroxylase
VDRLLVAALIEARSCERFRCLIETLERAPAEHAAPDVLALYRELFPAEARHYRQFVEWAIEEAQGAETAVRARLEALARTEAQVLARGEASGVRATIHG